MGFPKQSWTNLHDVNVVRQKNFNKEGWFSQNLHYKSSFGLRCVSQSKVRRKNQLSKNKSLLRIMFLSEITCGSKFHFKSILGNKLPPMQVFVSVILHKMEVTLQQCLFTQQISSGFNSPPDIKKRILCATALSWLHLVSHRTGKFWFTTYPFSCQEQELFSWTDRSLRK